MHSRRTRIVFSFLLIAIGILISNYGLDNKLYVLVYLGSSAIVTGFLSIIREFCFLRSESEELSDNIIKKAKELGNSIADKLVDKITELKDYKIGMHLIAHDRFSNYNIYDFEEDGADTIVLFGRSVLHRLDYNLKKEKNKTAEAVLFKKLESNSRIRIMFSDPTSSIVERIAMEDGTTSAALYEYLARTIGVCKRLDALLLKSATLPNKADIRIRTFDHIPYYAYHRVNNKAIIGFYLSTTSIGHQPAYEIVDQNEVNIFDQYFNIIFEKGNQLLECQGSTGKKYFNQEHYNNIYNYLCTKLQKEIVDRLITGDDIKT
jgi:hypothetical protein